MFLLKVELNFSGHDESGRTPTHRLDQDGAGSGLDVTCPHVLVHADAHGHHGRGHEFEFRTSVADAAAPWPFNLPRLVGIRAQVKIHLFSILAS